jgi:hypothetical protein
VDGVVPAPANLNVLFSQRHQSWFSSCELGCGLALVQILLGNNSTRLSAVSGRNFRAKRKHGR